MAYIEFKPNMKWASKGADVSDFHEAFKDCGYLLEDNDLVVDIDNLSKDTIRELIKTFNIDTQLVWTTRGVHLYFKKPRGFKVANGTSVLGIPFEYKHIKNTHNGITIKRNGVLREIENERKRQELPEVLKPVKGAEILLGVDSGRNNKLYAHKFRVLGLKDSDKIFKFINEYVFDEPLDENELTTVTRFEESKAEEGKEPLVAKRLMSYLKVVKYNDELYCYDGQKYVKDEFDNVVYDELPDMKTHYVEEVLKQMQKRTRNQKQQKHGFDIKLKNGILRKGKFYPVDSTDFTPYFIDIEYDSNVEPVEIVDEYLEQLSGGDKGYIKLILQMIAHGLITNPDIKRQIAKFFILIGDGGNGKGTLLTIIRHIFGNENCSSNSIKEIGIESYFAGMQGKLFNLGDDVDKEAIKNEEMKRLKNIATCDYVATRFLFKQSKDTVITTSMLFTSNHPLVSFEKGEAYKRRVVWCPMFSKPKKKDPSFISKITSPEALKYWVKLLVETYEELYENAEVTIPKIVEEHNKEYHADNDNTLLYVNDLSTDDIEGCRPPEVYERYQLWAEENGLSVHSKRMLKETIEKIHNLEVGDKRVNGKTAKVYKVK